MIITELPENEKEGDNIQVQTQKVPEIPSSRFWGVKVSPQEPVTVSFRNRPHKSLHISQATLGELCLDNMEKSRSGLSSKSGDNPEVLICSLRMKYREMARLSLDFDGPGDVVFSVKGPWEIHLVGYFFDHHSATSEVAPLQMFGNGENATSQNEGGIFSSGNEGGSVASEPQFSASNEGEICKHSKEAAPKLDIITQMNSPSLGHLRAVDVVDGLIKIRQEGGISILVQGLTKTQIEALGESLGDKLQGLMKHDSPDYHVLKSRKNKRLNKRKIHDDEGQDDHICSTKQDSCQYLELESKEAKKLKKKLKKQKQVEDDDHSSTKHEPCQNLKLDSKQAKKLKKRLKKKLKKQKQVEDDDHSAANDDGQQTLVSDSEHVEKSKKHSVEDDTVRSHNSSGDFAPDTMEAKKVRKPKQKVARDEVRVVNDDLPTLALDSGEAKKSKKNIVEDDSMRSTQYDDIPNDPKMDTGKATEARKKGKKVVQEQDRSHEAQHVTIVCALPCQGKR